MIKWWLVPALFFCLTASSQKDSIMYFKEIGWTIKLSSDFKIVDSSVVAEKQKMGGEMVEQSAHVKLDYSKTKYFLTTMKDNQNSFSANYTLSDRITKNNWQSIDSAEKGTLLETLTAQIPVKGDTVRSLATVDGIVFRKLKTSFALSSKMNLTVTYFGTFLKGKYFAVICVYTDSHSGSEMTEMLNHSKFDK